jgi:hypothetical protein
MTLYMLKFLETLILPLHRKWTAALGKILTAYNLRKRNIVLVNWCSMCKANGESVDHLLIHCPMAKDLWDYVLAFFGVHWVMLWHVRDLLDSWHGGLGRNRHSVIWKAVSHCLMWCLWREQCSKF